MDPSNPYCEWPETCHRHKENNKLPFCASHNIESRKAERTGSREKKVYNIPRVSKKGARDEAAKQKAYDHLKKTTEMVCSSCGTTHSLTPSHILPQSQYGSFKADTRNILWDCITCHHKYEHGTLAQCETLGNWKQRLDIIQLLSPIYFFRRFKLFLADYRREKNI